MTELLVALTLRCVPPLVCHKRSVSVKDKVNNHKG